MHPSKSSKHFLENSFSFSYALNQNVINVKHKIYKTFHDFSSQNFNKHIPLPNSQFNLTYLKIKIKNIN